MTDLLMLETPETSKITEFLTYEEAAKFLGLTEGYIAHLASDGVLHKMKVEGSRRRYLHRTEVEWFAKQRQGVALDEPNPINQDARRGVSTSAEVLIEKLNEVDMIEQNLSTIQSSQLRQLTELGPVFVLSLLLVVFALLLSFIAGQQPDDRKLIRLKTAPEFQPVRQALVQLVDRIAA